MRTVKIIQTGGTLALLVVLMGASTFAVQTRKAELLTCNEKTKQCLVIGTIYRELDCQMLVQYIDGVEKDSDMRLRLLQLYAPKPSSTPSEPSATPSASERMHKIVEDAQKLVDQNGRQYYMCRPI